MIYEEKEAAYLNAAKKSLVSEADVRPAQILASITVAEPKEVENFASLISSQSKKKRKVNRDNLVIPDEIQAKHGKLINLLVNSQSVDQEEAQYWIDALSIMSKDQVANLEGILKNEKQQIAAAQKAYGTTPKASTAKFVEHVASGEGVPVLPLLAGDKE